jgi:nitrile hydratase accessory protein
VADPKGARDGDRRREPAAALDLAGPAAPPRRNGELVFEAPWESRLFGVTLALCERGVFAWEDFRRLLIEEIARFDAGGHPPGTWSYYARWQAAFERLLRAKGLCAGPELEARVHALGARPAGHDHGHEHPGGHGPDREGTTHSR